MKKAACIVIALLCLCAFTVPCFAVTDVTFNITAEQQPKENVVVSVNISKDSSLYTTEFYITFDPNALEFVKGSETAGEITQPLNPYITAGEVEEGKVKISYTSTQQIDIRGTLCTLEFRALNDSATRLEIDIDHAETFDGDHIRTLTTQGIDGIIEITKQPVFPTAAVTVTVIVAVAAVIAAFVAKKKKRK